jgi:hypothetical protein
MTNDEGLINDGEVLERDMVATLQGNSVGKRSTRGAMENGIGLCLSAFGVEGLRGVRIQLVNFLAIQSGSRLQSSTARTSTGP